MSVKNKIIEILEQNREIVISGQDLADTLQVSRTAIWKAVNSLKQEGHAIVSVSNKGYRLESNSDVLSAEGIGLYLHPEYKGYPVQVYDSLDSTNSQAKRLAVEGACHGTIVLAEQQTAGRGRLGKSFYSPAQQGIYMSIVLRPEESIALSLKITVAAAVAVCRAIEDFTEEAPEIKWVNDVFFRGKKVCGILTEGVTDFESGTVESIVVGIGVNAKLREEELPDELRAIVGTVSLKNLSRNQLASAILNELFILSESLSDERLMDEYRAYSMVLGKEITYQKDGQEFRGRAMNINQEGSLIIQGADGTETVLRSGTISLGSQQFIR